MFKRKAAFYPGLVCLNLLLASIGYADGPPVPGFYEMPARPAIVYNLLDTVALQKNRLQLIAQPGNRLVIKSQFVLDQPNRLVVDIANTQLNLNTLPSTLDALGGTVRFGQFLGDTARLVIEVPDPERLSVMTDGNVLTITSSPSLMGSFFGHFFNHQPQQTQPVATQSRPLSRTPVPYTAMSAPQTYSHYPALSNLQRLQMHPLTGNPSGFSQRAHILEIARSQLGISKDTQPDYVNHTYSEGQNEAWCADFISTILEWAGGSPWGHLSRVQNIYEWGVQQGRLTNRPEPADAVIFRYGITGFDHVALVESINPDNTITTIGGNEGYALSNYRTTGTVERSVYSLEDRRILGFVDPVSAPMADEPRPTSISRSGF